MERTVIRIEYRGLTVDVASDGIWFTVYRGEEIVGTIARPHRGHAGWQSYRKDGRQSNFGWRVGPRSALIELAKVI